MSRLVNIIANVFSLHPPDTTYPSDVYPGSTITVVDADGGVISGNTIASSGLNFGPAGGENDAGAIRLIGCRDLAVSHNNITTPPHVISSVPNRYDGFGIVTRSHGSRISRCIISNNHIAGATTTSQGITRVLKNVIRVVALTSNRQTS